MNFSPKLSTSLVSLLILILFSVSVMTGYYLALFPIYILTLIATSTSAEVTFKTTSYLCLISMLVSSYLALSQLSNLDLGDFVTPIIAISSAFTAYIILLSSHAQIHNDKINERQKTQMLQQLSGSVAHDFNNTLSVVMGNAELLKEKGSQLESSKLFIDTILKAIQKGSHLTQSLLSFAQKQFLYPANINLNQLILNYLNGINLPLQDRDKIYFTATKDLWMARIDPTFFEECLLHLIQNAIQANSGHIKINVSNMIDHSSVEHTLAVSMRYLLIVISDDGVGIAVQDLKRIYQPFFTTKKNATAKGLGLSTVWGFCQQSGGYIDVQSTLKKGTTFKIVVPGAMQKE